VPALDRCREATEVRRRWLAEWLTRQTPPKGAAGFIAGTVAVCADLFTSVDGNHQAEWLGQSVSGYGRSDALAALIDRADKRRPQVLTLALVLAACEAHVGKDTWRCDGTTDRHGPNLRFLASHGCTLARSRTTPSATNPSNPEPIGCRLCSGGGTSPTQGGTDAESRRRDAVLAGGGLA